ncbi:MULTISPECIES: hypothetical protein [unclassified Geodermatophilus]
MTHPHDPAPGSVPVGGWTPWGTWDPAAGQPPSPAPAPPVPPPPARSGLGGAALVAAGLVLGLVLAAVVGGVLVRGAVLDAGREAGEAVGESVSEGLSGGFADPLAAGGGLGEVEQSAPVPPGELGPDPVLDGYAQQCFEGDLQSCDDLYVESPPLSEYEEYGLSCGGRVKAWAVPYCTDLD